MKDPAFPFYAQDFLTGTIYMDFETVGRYIKLLAIQWDKGPIPKKRLGLLVGFDWVNFSEDLKEKFTEDENYIWNARLEKERDKRAAFRLKQKENGIKGGRPKNPNKTQIKPKQNQNINPNKTLLEDENENENENINEYIKGGVGEKINFADLENEQWFLSIRSFLGNKINYQVLLDYWEKYKLAMIADDDLYREKNTYRSHFRNWVKIQAEKDAKQTTGGILKPKYELLNDL